jgi:Protein of unknown function (DUF938)
LNPPLDTRQYAPATDRNREPILEVLLEVLPPTGTVLEISSGTGEHAVFFAPRVQPRQWIPSDPNSEARLSIAAWRQYSPAENLYPPIALNASDPSWAVEQPVLPEALQQLDLQQYPIEAIVNINMIHIAPWSACLGLMAGAGRILPPDGILYLYGPYKRNGKHTAPSNEAFDQSLRSRNSEWGVRDLEAVIAIAQAQNLSLVSVHPMPANNLSVVFRALG